MRHGSPFLRREVDDATSGKHHTVQTVIFDALVGVSLTSEEAPSASAADHSFNKVFYRPSISHAYIAKG